MDNILRFPSAVKHDPAIDAWLRAQRDDLRPLVETWFAHMRQCGGEGLEERDDGLRLNSHSVRVLFPRRAMSPVARGALPAVARNPALATREIDQAQELGAVAETVAAARAPRQVSHISPVRPAFVR